MKLIDTWKQHIGFSIQNYLFSRNNGRTYYSEILDNLCRIRSFCNQNPTCKDCPFCSEHEGCMFRGRSPREW